LLVCVRCNTSTGRRGGVALKTPMGWMCAYCFFRWKEELAQGGTESWCSHTGQLPPPDSEGACEGNSRRPRS